MKKWITLTVILACFTLLLSCNRQQQVAFEGGKEINGTELHLNIMGQGEPLVIIHGGPGLNHRYFLPHLKPLAEDFLLIFYDQRASGRSSVELDSTQMTLDRFIGDIEGIRKKLGYDTIHLLGHSWGGFLAMQYALRYPEKLRSLVLSNSAPASSHYLPKIREITKKTMSKQDSLDRTELMQSEAFQNREVSAFEELMRISFRNSFYDSQKLDELVIDLGPQYYKGAALLRHLASEITSYDLYSELAGLDVPVLILHGRADLMPPESVRSIQDTLPDSRMVIFEKSGHFPFIEEPELFHSVVSHFLTENNLK